MHVALEHLVGSPSSEMPSFRPIRSAGSRPCTVGLRIVAHPLREDALELLNLLGTWRRIAIGAISQGLVHRFECATVDAALDRRSGHGARRAVNREALRACARRLTIK